MLGSVVVSVVQFKSVTHEGPFQFECFHKVHPTMWAAGSSLILNRVNIVDVKKKLRGSDIDLS